MRAFCVTWERRAVGNGCFFSVLVGFERRASNGVKRAFFVVQVKEKRQAVSSGRLSGGVGAWAQAGCSNENDEKSRNKKKTRHKARKD